jgi:transglycosylase-like protein with SLT domain
MSNGRRGMSTGRAGMLAAVALACGVGSALAGDPAPGPGAGHGADQAAGPGAAAKARPLPGLAPGATLSAETVHFADPRRAPVRVMRGPRNPASPLPVSGPAPGPTTGRTEIVSFGIGFAQRVTVMRGIPTSPAGAAPTAPGAQTRIEKISFADPALPAVTVMRGIVSRDAFAVDLFGPANGGELDRIAFAVDGVESRHGADLRMWRPEPQGPQGPMQVSAAAAFDVGGGDRFDLHQNRLLGRAYLAQMFRRYGNWSDALAAYNWGPGNLDLWIAGGRNPDRMPPGVAYYVARVLRDALIGAVAAGR